ncbi:PASTA domain-containing protein [Vagococcus bubulae]|uniref:PASTA domain-containing protein n=1 Tax=Vagococcus bubulae TaxID=1977868 RepID=A0A429ZRI6_9ENTE|nr:PASTA domain-containing protein [Vagococcus bubulae]RST96334.1 hypothetical protein CBF36_00975 [Vagococcus bubulae]
MSDFLSNFDNDNYQDTLNNKQKNKETFESDEFDALDEAYRNDDVPQRDTDTPRRKKKRKRKRKTSPSPTEKKVTPPEILEPFDETTEIDYDYKNRQQKRKMTIAVGALTTCLIFYFIYYQVTRVTVPDFKDKTIVDVKKWADDNRIKTEATQAYSNKVDANGIITQSVAPKKKIKKGSNMTFKVSEGANPKEKIELPEFEKMTKTEVEQWIAEKKADNVSIIDEYNDKIEKGKFIKLEFTDKEVNKENYLRQDIANVYFSKGKEVFEKNISVPDFNKKAKTEVEEWAKKNEIDMEYKEVDSDKVESGLIVSQSVEPKAKIAKHDKMSVSVSVGKAVTVPNFAEYSTEDASSLSGGLQVMTKEMFSDTVPYGQLISQSVEPGKKLTSEGEKIVNVVYSAGKPYIKSYFGQLEGDIPKLIYDNFNSKGASVTYEVYYVDSENEKGQIVSMNVYNQYIPMNSHLVFGISNGAYAPLPTISNN